MKGRDKLLALADRLHAEDGPACAFVRKNGRSESYSFGYRRLFGRRFLIVKDSHCLPIALIPADGKVPRTVLHRMSESGYSRCEGLVSESACGAVYPLSIVQGIQRGDIYVSGGNTLLWHKCGFAFVYGGYDEPFLEEIYRRFLSPESVTERRFVLFCEDERTRLFFAGKAGIAVGKRYFFEYPASSAQDIPEMPEGFAVRPIDDGNIADIVGRITPQFSWDSREAFLKKGMGFCVMNGDRPAAWAFSAAVSSKEIDIGVETSEDHRRMGLASAASLAMI